MNIHSKSINVYKKLTHRSKVSKSNSSSKDLKIGDYKLDRSGRHIYFAGYSKELSKKGKKIELWQPEPISNAK